MSGPATLHCAPLEDVDPRTLYRILRLRVDVFVVEQECPYPDLDGRDLEPGARLVWLAGAPDDGAPDDGAPDAVGPDDAGPDDAGPGDAGARAAAPDRAVLATARLLDDPDGALRVGRIATAVAARGRGLAGRLLRFALAEAGARDVVLDAQAHLAAWYAGFGFAVVGPEYLEDGIPHVPMRRVGAA